MSNKTVPALADTTPLTLEGDLANQMVAALDRYVTHAVAASLMAATNLPTAVSKISGDT